MVLNGKNISKFDKEFIKIQDEDSNKGYILEIDVEYPILSERMKIKKMQ